MLTSHQNPKKLRFSKILFQSETFDSNASNEPHRKFLRQNLIPVAQLQVESILRGRGGVIKKQDSEYKFLRMSDPEEIGILQHQNQHLVFSRHQKQHLLFWQQTQHWLLLTHDINKA